MADSGVVIYDEQCHIYGLGISHMDPPYLTVQLSEVTGALVFLLPLIILCTKKK